MQFLSFSTVAVALTAFSARALACLEFQMTITQLGYGTGTLTDNGNEICRYNGYGDNTGYDMNCQDGFACRVDNGASSVLYTAPWGQFQFEPSCTAEYSGTPGANLNNCYWKGYDC